MSARCDDEVTAAVTTGRLEGNALRIAIVAGEASGDQLAAGLIAALRERGVDVQAEGIFGAEVEALGYASCYPMQRLSVMGLFESFGRYPELLPLRARLARQWANDRPDMFIGVDAPDFNLTLELALRRAGIPTVHYVSPSVWAWRRYRIRKIARAVDRMLTLFPFEADFYREHRVPVTFVGHPLADRIPMVTDRDACRRELGVATGGPVIALLPGSRISEVRYLAEPLLATAAWLHARRPEMRFLVPLVDDVTRECFTAAMSAWPRNVPLALVEGRARTVMGAADTVLLASGTATLEALLVKRPMVVTYRTTEATYRIMKAMFHVRHVGLPNLLAGRELVPELLQHDAVPERLGPAVLGLLDDRARCEHLMRVFTAMHKELRGGASERAARAVLEVAAQR